MNAITNPGRPLLGMAITLLLAGCAMGASPTRVPTSPTPLATPTAAVPTLSPTPSAATGRIYVSGTMTCEIVGEEDPAATGEYQPGTLFIDCAYEMSDPRVTGTNHAELSATFVGLEAVDGTSNFWVSSETLTAAGGTWQGSGYGSEFVSEPIEPKTLYTTGTAVYQGHGAFDGLTYRVFFARVTPLLPGVAYIVSGWIEPTK